MADTKQLYNSKRWQIRSRRQLREHPLCRMCLDEGWVSAAKVADHITPHKGNAYSFYYGALQSLCISHHNKSKREIENKGYCTDIGIDGNPTDPRHPYNMQRTIRP